MLTEASIRKLARSRDAQIVYARAKDMGIKLFDNQSDLTPIQLNFLQWLEIYNSLYGDLFCHKEGLTEKVIDNDFLCDGYLIWERREREAQAKPQTAKRQERDKKAEKSAEVTGIPRISFA